MEYRELQIWLKEAQIVEVQKSLNDIAIARTAMLSSEGYKNVESTLKNRLRELHMSKEEALKESWNSLKSGGNKWLLT